MELLFQGSIMFQVLHFNVYIYIYIYIYIFIYIYFFLAVLCDMLDLSSPARV